METWGPLWVDDGDELGMKPIRKETVQREVSFQTFRRVLQRVTGVKGGGRLNTHKT